MRTNYTIKNFRVFDKKGVTVEMSPLTFLVGCNSSGKSSIVKSLSLLKTFFQEHNANKQPVIGTPIDFSIKPNNTLGSFRNVVCSSSRDKTITMAYTTHSCYLNEDVEVSISIGEGELGNGIVSGVQIKRINGEIIASRNKKGYSGSLESIKQNFARYLVAIRFRSELNAKLPNDPEEYNRFIQTEDYKQLVKSLSQEALTVCDKQYLTEVFKNRAIKQCRLNDKAKLSIDKFIDTGILTYFSIFDNMENMKSVEEVRHFLRSKVKDDEVKDAMFKAIDLICEDYIKKGEPGFLEYYRSLENEEISGSGFYRFDSVLKYETNGMPSLRKSLFSHSIDNVYSLLWDMGGDVVHLWRSSDENVEDTRISLVFVMDTLSHLYDDGIFYDVYHKMLDYTPERRYIHPLFFDSMDDYVNYVFDEVISNDITNSLDYISSSRIQVRRMYPMEDKTEFTDAVKRYFETRSKFMTLSPPIRINLWSEDGNIHHEHEVSSFVPGSFMNKWLRIFKIGDHMSLEMDKNGLGLLLKVYRNETDKKGVLLADMGYGITQLFSILLQIEEMIMSTLYKEFNGKTSRSGLLFEESVETVLKPQTVAIEEPEIHLHPKFQSLLAEMFYEAYKDYNIHFIVETHSEYLLRKIQTLVGAKKLIPEEISMIYVEDNDEVSKGAQKVRRIPIKDDGRLAAPFSPGFYDEADNLSLELFTNMGK